MIEEFSAAAQYDDMKGSAAADRADSSGISGYLSKNGLIKDDEILVAVSFFAGENHGTHTDPIFVEVFVAPKTGNLQEYLNSSDSPSLRRIKLSLSISEFLGFFKRFSVTLSYGGILEGRSISYEE